MRELSRGTYADVVTTARNRDILGTLVVGVPLAVASGIIAFLSLPPAKAVTLTVAFTIATAALALRRKLPQWSFAVVCAACVVQSCVTGLFLILPSSLAFPISLYSLIAWGRERDGVTGVLCGLAGATLASWRLVTDHSVIAAGFDPDPVMVWALLTAIIVAAGGLGMWRRTQLAYLDILTERARHAEADRAARTREAVRQERQRIARDMHDIVAHSLSVMISQAQGGRFAAATDAGLAAEVLSTIESEGRQALMDMRGLVGVLRLDPATTSDGPQPRLDQLPELLTRTTGNTGRRIEFTETGSAKPLSASAELAIYRLVQESLTNAIRHTARPTTIKVDINWTSDAATVEVTNKGATASPQSEDGYGLIGMSERIAAVGGVMFAGIQDGTRFVVSARIPYLGHSLPQGKP